MTRPINSILVVGAGTAGLVTALMLRERNPDVPVEVLYSARIGHIMVGEGTWATAPNMFHTRAGIDPTSFFAAVKPTPKLGARFIWGANGEFNYTFDTALSVRADGASQLPRGYGFADGRPLVAYSLASALMEAGRVQAHGDPVPKTISAAPTAYHMENDAFVAYLMATCKARGIVLTEGELAGSATGTDGIESVTTKCGRTMRADLYVDCSGFSGALIHKALGEPYHDMRDHLFCDRAVIGGWARTDEPLLPYTTAETMDAGWCWQIEHGPIINRGYVYCSAFIEDGAAEAEFRRKNPKVGDTRIVPFASRHIRRAWVGNVVAIGNANGFVEPLEATNISLICNFASRLADAVSVSRLIDPMQVNAFNRYVNASWRSVRDFLAAHYKFNHLLDTPFWRHAREATPLGDATEMVAYYRSVGPDPTGMAAYLPEGDLFGVPGYINILLGCGEPFRYNEQLVADDRERALFDIKVNRALAARCSRPDALDAPDWALYGKATLAADTLPRAGELELTDA